MKTVAKNRNRFHFLSVFLDFGTPLELVVGQRDNHAADHQTHQDQDQVIPTDARNGTADKGTCQRRRHIVEEVQKARYTRHHTRVAQAGAIAAPQHGCCRVGSRILHQKK